MQCYWTESLKRPDGTRLSARCNREATRVELDKNGAPWTHLCVGHADVLDEALKVAEDAPKILMRTYVRAAGGPKRLAETMP